MARVACRDDMIGDIMRHDAARADDDIAADRHARQYAAVSAEPNVAPDRDEEGIFIEPISLFAVDGMVRSIKAAARTDEHIVTEGDLAGVKEHAVVIDEQIVAGFDVIAEADVDVLLCTNVFPDLMHDFAEDSLTPGKI